MKVVELVYKYNSKTNVIIAAAIALIGMTLIFTQYFGFLYLADEKALDVLHYYDQSMFYSVLNSLTASDIFAYKLIHLADYVFIIGLYPLVSFSLSKVIRRTSSMKYLVLLPLIAGDFDLLENLMMDIHLYFHPTEFMFLGSISGIFTAMKFLLLYISVLVLFVLCLKRKLNTIKGRSSK